MCIVLDVHIIHHTCREVNIKSILTLVVTILVNECVMSSNIPFLRSFGLVSSGSKLNPLLRSSSSGTIRLFECISTGSNSRIYCNITITCGENCLDSRCGRSVTSGYRQTVEPEPTLAAIITSRKTICSICRSQSDNIICEGEALTSTQIRLVSPVCATVCGAIRLSSRSISERLGRAIKIYCYLIDVSSTDSFTCCIG